MSFIAQMPQMQAESAIGAMCGLVGGVAILTLAGAVVLRAACALYNKIAGGSGSSNSVPEPDFGWSLLICIGRVVAGFGIRIVMTIMGAALEIGPIVQYAIALPVGFLVWAWILSGTLPTTFGRAALVTLLEYVIGIASAMVILCILFALGLMGNSVRR